MNSGKYRLAPSEQHPALHIAPDGTRIYTDHREPPRVISPSAIEVEVLCSDGITYSVDIEDLVEAWLQRSDTAIADAWHNAELHHLEERNA